MEAASSFLVILKCRLVTFAIFLKLLTAAALAGDESLPASTTGARTWTMADGSERKLRLVEVGGNPPLAKFQYRHTPAGIRLSEFSADDLAFIHAIQEGRIKLLKTPGLSATAAFPAGPLRNIDDGGYRVGDVRQWTHRNGGKVSGQLINLNDEEVSILIGEKVWNLALGDISADDLRYLEEVKDGKARIVPLQIYSGSSSWNGGTSHFAVFRSHQFAGEPANDRRFEEACNRAIDEVKSKLSAGSWEFVELEEDTISTGESNERSLLSPSEARDPEAVFYQATFRLTPKGRREAVAIWPLTMTPPDWGGTHELRIYLAPNSEVATVRKFR